MTKGFLFSVSLLLAAPVWAQAPLSESDFTVQLNQHPVALGQAWNDALSASGETTYDGFVGEVPLATPVINSTVITLMASISTAPTCGGMIREKRRQLYRRADNLAQSCPAYRTRGWPLAAQKKPLSVTMAPVKRITATEANGSAIRLTTNTSLSHWLAVKSTVSILTLMMTKPGSVTWPSTEAGYARRQDLQDFATFSDAEKGKLRDLVGHWQ